MPRPRIELPDHPQALKQYLIEYAQTHGYVPSFQARRFLEKRYSISNTTAWRRLREAIDQDPDLSWVEVPVKRDYSKAEIVEKDGVKNRVLGRGTKHPRLQPLSRNEKAHFIEVRL